MLEVRNRRHKPCKTTTDDLCRFRHVQAGWRASSTSTNRIRVSYLCNNLCYQSYYINHAQPIKVTTNLYNLHRKWKSRVSPLLQQRSLGTFHRRCPASFAGFSWQFQNIRPSSHEGYLTVAAVTRGLDRQDLT